MVLLVSTGNFVKRCEPVSREQVTTILSDLKYSEFNGFLTLCAISNNFQFEEASLFSNGAILWQPGLKF